MQGFVSCGQNLKIKSDHQSSNSSFERGGQCRDLRASVMCFSFLVPVTKYAATF